jgi:exosortase
MSEPRNAAMLQTAVPALPGGSFRWTLSQPGMSLAFLLAVLWAYWPTFHALAYRWASDPQYTHGYLVPVFALIVLWWRRHLLRESVGSALGAVVTGLTLLFLAVGLRQLGAMQALELLDELSLLPCLAGICLMLGGWSVLRWAWPALAFLMFILPIPYQAAALSSPLRNFATLSSVYALQTLGVPAIAEGNIIIVDEMHIGVVEACSGLGMLMTFFALSTAVAFVMRRPMIERLIVFASAVPIGVLMNVARITVTVFLYRCSTAEVAHIVFHDLAGWVMMPTALCVLYLEMRFLESLWPGVKPTGADTTQESPAWLAAIVARSGHPQNFPIPPHARPSGNAPEPERAPVVAP